LVKSPNGLAHVGRSYSKIWVKLSVLVPIPHPGTNGVKFQPVGVICHPCGTKKTQNHPLGWWWVVWTIMRQNRSRGWTSIQIPEKKGIYK